MTPIVVSFPGGQRVDAQVGGHIVRTDQPIANGGSDTAPDPFSFFLASLATCAGFYVQAFCSARKIPMLGVQLTLNAKYDDQKRLCDVVVDIQLPADFPERYVSGVQAAANSCKVKKVLAAPPNVLVEVARAPAMKQ
ncbi:MAG: OsmC family protein, partial [Myxococcales bacterium]|nr:OsmC family protein [Myxococcales bacterium]